MSLIYFYVAKAVLHLSFPEVRFKAISTSMFPKGWSEVVQRRVDVNMENWSREGKSPSEPIFLMMEALYLYSGGEGSLKYHLSRLHAEDK